MSKFKAGDKVISDERLKADGYLADDWLQKILEHEAKEGYLTVKNASGNWITFEGTGNLGLYAEDLTLYREFKVGDRIRVRDPFSDVDGQVGFITAIKNVAAYSDLSTKPIESELVYEVSILGEGSHKRSFSGYQLAAAPDPYESAEQPRAYGGYNPLIDPHKRPERVSLTQAFERGAQQRKIDALEKEALDIIKGLDGTYDRYIRAHSQVTKLFDKIREELRK